MGMTRCLFNVDRSITGRRSLVFFGTWNSLLKKLEGAAPVDKLYGRLSTAFCRSCFFFLAENWMGILVKGGWWHSHFNRTPDRSILDDLHSPSRFCQCWAKPASRAPTNINQLAEPPPACLHGLAPLDGPAVFLDATTLVLLPGFLDVPTVVLAVVKKLMLRGLFCCPPRKGWLLPSWWS